MIEIRSLFKSYHTGVTVEVLKGVDMYVEKGEFISIMGASGSGKSTLLNILGILDYYDKGDYYLDGTLVETLNEAEAAHLRNKKIGFVFQSFNLISYKNAIENVALPLYYQKITRKKRIKQAYEYLDRLGILDFAEHLPCELSGGQKQRVAIARALITKPLIVLADEPTGALDSETSAEMMQLLRQLNTDDKITMLIVTHDLAVANSTDRIFHIKDGLIETDEINERPRIDF